MGNNLFRNFLLSVYLLLLFANRYFGIAIINLLLYAFGFICFLFYFFRAIEGRIRFCFKTFFLVICLLINIIFVINYNQNLSFFSVFIAASYFGAALLMNNTVIKSKLSYLPFIFNCFYLALFYIRDRSFVNVFADQSVNYVSIMMILSLFPIYISQYQNGLKRSNYGVICISIFFSVLALGRGGILSCILLLFLTIYYRIFNEKLKRNAILMVMVVMVGIIFMGLLAVILPRLLGHLPGFQEKGMDSNGRLLVWGIWLAKNFSSAKGIIFGENVISNIPDVFPHLHNSYLMFYADYGLIGFLFCIFCLIKLGAFLHKTNTSLFSLFFVFCFRAFTDVVFGNFYGDFFLFYFIIIYFYKSKKLFSVYDKFSVFARRKENCKNLSIQ
ncbi:MAG: O-antigen ligase family protein [Treponema sp.]|nr:O-antigen ligase family protein [Treponema sp.]